MSESFIVCRVDREPPVFFKGMASWGHPETTTERAEAQRLTVEDARDVVFILRIDRGGVWGIRQDKERSEE